MLIGFLDKYARKCERLTLYRALQSDLLLRLVKKHHKLGRRQELALPHPRQIGRDLAERLWRDRDDGAEDRPDEGLRFRRAVEDRHDARQVAKNVGLWRWSVSFQKVAS